MGKFFRIPFLAFATVFAVNASAGGGAAHIEDVRTSAPAITLNAFEIENRSELVISVRNLDDQALEVTAVAGGSPGLALPVRFMLRRGDEISFAMPEKPEKVYTFRFDLDRVFATVSEIEFSTAALNE